MITINDQLKILIHNGQARHDRIPDRHTSGEEAIFGFIEECWLTLPKTYSPLCLESKNLLSSYIAQGLLPGVNQADIKNFTEDEAKFFIECAERNRWRGEKRFLEYFNRTLQDIAPADPEQISHITALGREGFLNRLSSETKLKLTHLSADRLIWRGEMNRREERHVSSKH